MALLNKLFFSSSSKRKGSTPHQSQTYISQFPFDKSQIRIIVYRECDNRGRRLLFDSTAIKRVNLKESCDIHRTGRAGGQQGRTQFTKSGRTFVQISNEYSYEHCHPTADITEIGEMIFGALAMSFRGTALKVHWLQLPPRILCSQVFLSPMNTSSLAKGKQSKDNSGQFISNCQFSSDNNSITSLSMPYSVCINRNLNQTGDKSLTSPLDVPVFEICADNAQRQPALSTNDSGYEGTENCTASVSSCCQYSTTSSLGSVFDDHDSSRKLSLDSSTGEYSFSKNNKWSDSNIQRRISRNMYTSFENKTSTSDFIGYLGDNYEVLTNGGSDGCVARFQKINKYTENRSNPEIRQRRCSGETVLNISSHGRNLLKRAKIGLAVCITISEQYEKEMEQFICEHIGLLESMLCRLRASVENAYINHKNFLQIMVQAWQNAVTWITDLFTSPRLPLPVWIDIGSSDKKMSKTLADSFVKELCWLLSYADTKDTNFFISKLLSAVLTNHLGWVTIILATKHKPKLGVSQKIQLDELSYKHPYNALWAQIGDLYGAIGNPTRISRTIVYGKEKICLERLLKILTYFIRSGEIRRASKSEIFNKEAIDALFLKKQKEQSTSLETEIKKLKPVLTRSKTCLKSLGEINYEESNENDMAMQNSELKKNVMNDIPNVLAFRDSHFVQQELRIGNHLMDTGIERNQRRSSCSIQQESKIHVTLTNPDNIEIAVDCIEAKIVNNTKGIAESVGNENCCTAKISGNQKCFSLKDFSWNNDAVKNGFTCKDVEIQAGLEKPKVVYYSENAFEDNKENVQTQNTGCKLKKHASLSDLITANSVGQSERFTWGIEPMKEKVCLEEEKHFELGKKIIEQKKGLNEGNSSVVFVLGDNEALVNIKKSSDNLPETTKATTPSKSQTHVCNHHKKHSGVKFNFEQYPQIATNYMKSKNLDISDYKFFEKSSKLENLFEYEPSTSSFAVELPKSDDNSFEKCEYCAGIKTLQTPSNATELEFETNDNYIVLSPKQSDPPNNINNLPTSQSETSSMRGQILEIRNVAGPSEEKKSVSLNLTEVPTPNFKNDEHSRGEIIQRSGFVPSLFVGITDHYISDMVLQGTSSTPQMWEIKLKQDLSLASHCASFTSSPTENVAIIADMEKWDVRIISSQAHSLMNAGTICGPVDMSQLVATMLETVLAMNSSGISSYECLSYIESKLQEMYLQSEVLAAFLLATEFCSLNTLTAALNLSANDVPLLLSIASIHSPQVTKKYGISFR